MSSVERAHQELACLYQQKESQLRKEHVYKHGIPQKELTHALESLRKRLPRLMINEEDTNVYMVGSKSDVSEAKQIIGDIQGFGTEKEIHPDHLFVSSQSRLTFLKKGSTASSEPSGIHSPSFQDSHDLFMPKKDLKNANQREISSENSSKIGHNSADLKNFDDHSPTGQFSFPSQRIKKATEDIFSLRETEVSQVRHVPSDLEWTKPGNQLDRSKNTDSLFDSSKLSASQSILDTNQKLLNKSDFNSETTEHQSRSDTRLIDSESQIKSSKGYKTKQTEPGKERKMAANFSLEMSSGIKNLTDYKTEAPKLVDGTYVKERKFPDSGQPHSLPLIKPSMNCNLDPNTLHGSASAKTSTSKMDVKELKGDMSKPGHVPYDKKTTLTPACLSGDQEVKSFPIMSSGSTPGRSNSFSAKIKKGEEPTQIAVNLSAGQKGISQNFQTREIVAMDLVLPFRLWLYLRSVYNTEIDHLTSDLQVKENLDKEDITLCLRGVDSVKVGECRNGLNSLITTAEIDFNTRTLPLSKLGVSDSRDKTLLSLCTLMMQRYKQVKILVLSNDVVILGPRPLCDEIEATMISIIHKGENIANSKLENEKPPNPDSLHTSKAPDSDFKSLGGHSTTSAKPHTDIIMKDLSKMSDQNDAYTSKKVPQVLTKQTRDNQEQDKERGTQNKTKEEKLEQLDKKHPTSQGDGGTMDNENGETLSGSIINSATKYKADGENNSDHTSTTAQRKETFPEQMNPGISEDQIGDSQGSEPKNDILPSHASGNQSVVLCYVCEKEYDTVKQAKCGYNFCPECDKEVHNNCKICGTSGIKGTMSVQDSSITIPGFPRDITTKIIYDIPDGIQGVRL